jgi:hypothetical protein
MISLNRRASFVLAIACALRFDLVAAQEVTGALTATIEDPQGAALRGATVRVSSSTLMGGPQFSTSNARGQLRFPALPPGIYALEVQFQGFRSYREEGIRVGVGATIERRVRLALAGLEDSVVVQGSGSRLEARSSGFETRFGPEDLKGIPVRRSSMFDFIRAAPGLSPTSPGSVTDAHPNDSKGRHQLLSARARRHALPHLRTEA